MKLAVVFWEDFSDAVLAATANAEDVVRQGWFDRLNGGVRIGERTICIPSAAKMECYRHHWRADVHGLIDAWCTEKWMDSDEVIATELCKPFTRVTLPNQDHRVNLSACWHDLVIGVARVCEEIGPRARACSTVDRDCIVQYALLKKQLGEARVAYIARNDLVETILESREFQKLIRSR